MLEEYKKIWEDSTYTYVVIDSLYPPIEYSCFYH